MSFILPVGRGGRLIVGRTTCYGIVRLLLMALLVCLEVFWTVLIDRFVETKVRWVSFVQLISGINLKARGKGNETKRTELNDTCQAVEF
ncbi:hypothetical protein M5689_019491 [Euphorbia peplus]|nr:hypothetical protein M5689_019491 [Euphorbia peplus]